MTTLPAVPAQTYASGSPITSKYGELGGSTGQKLVAPLTAIMWFCVGKPGSGKSALLQGCPDAFIINLDESSITAPVPRATVWPWMDPETGRATDASGPIILTWELISKKLETLKRLAKESKPRPKMVVLDGLGAAILLLKPWIASNAQRLGISTTPKDGWKDLHGPAAWDALYDILVNTLRDLHSHGYGVCYVGHVVNAKIPLGEDRFVFKPELTITDGFYKRLFGWFEMVAAVSVRPISEERTVIDRITLNGKPQETSRKVTSSVSRRVFVTDDTDLDGILKPRVTLSGAIVLPEDGWPTVEKAYTDAARLVSPSTPASPAV